MSSNLTAQGVTVITERLRFLPFVDDTSGIVEQLNVCVISKASGLKLCYVENAQLKSFERHAREEAIHDQFKCIFVNVMVQLL